MQNITDNIEDMFIISVRFLQRLKSREMKMESPLPQSVQAKTNQSVVNLEQQIVFLDVDSLEL